ncbi:hypothetical protein [Paenibacillus apis]|uniref:Uncharacterized protein n=1 Tax=Paenibacillus apis TaxID=1792174 RepID=A0A919Y1X0_9BACL|nr:hypothetical protein [Paenibacillus apis]GIO40773.1 hypothetical protein J41TS4_05310 [Paenibacillus apis]
MKRIYYSSRNKKSSVDIYQVYVQLQSLFLYFRNKDFFYEKLRISSGYMPEEVSHKAVFEIKFNPFPINKWDRLDINEDKVFDTMEFLYHHVSKPGEQTWMQSETGIDYQEYIDFDEDLGKQEFRDAVNMIINDYDVGFELVPTGEILAKGNNGLEEILEAEIPEYDNLNIDTKVKNAIKKWKNRNLSASERKQAVLDLADVFEWLKKTDKLSEALDKKDESALFEIANNFSLRHHNPNQKSNYDTNIWHSWIFHFYLATYHAVIRTLKKKGI